MAPQGSRQEMSSEEGSEEEEEEELTEEERQVRLVRSFELDQWLGILMRVTYMWRIYAGNVHARKRKKNRRYSCLVVIISWK